MYHSYAKITCDKEYKNHKLINEINKEFMIVDINRFNENNLYKINNHDMQVFMVSYLTTKILSDIINFLETSPNKKTIIGLKNMACSRLFHPISNKNNVYVIKI